MTRILMVLGKKPKHGESISPELVERLTKAIELFRDHVFHWIVISGGPTRKGMCSEAEGGDLYMCKNLHAKSIPVLLEKESRTTAQNVLFTKKMLRSNIERLTVITAPYHVRRVRFLLWKLWPETRGTVDVISVGDSPLKEKIVEAILLCIAVIDPYEKYILPFFIRHFRNG